jgi:hypothetical protein
MDKASLLLDGGRAAVRSHVWDFLERRRFLTKTLGFGGWISLDFLGFPWISLDFLGFSRPKRDLSTGYTRFSLKVSSSRFFRRE